MTPSAAAAPRFRTDKLSEKVTRVLAGRIVVAVGSGANVHLPTEQEVCEEFGVSKTVAREVMARLEALKLVSVRHGRRMQLRPASDWNYLDPLMLELQDEAGVRRLVGELTDVRMLIEPEAAARAAEAASPDQIVIMRESLDGMRENIHRPHVFLEHDIAFHREVVVSARNRVISHLVDAIADLMRTSRRLTNAVPGALAHTVEDHAAVLAAIEARDAEGARRAMRDHILWGAQRAGVLPEDGSDTRHREWIAQDQS